MDSVGIICEYNPFHNGHLYHIKKTKELFPNSTLILIVSGNVTQRGELSTLTKWEKTEIALHYGVDLVIELPFLYATQSADMFCYGSIKLLASLGINAIVFGAEIGNIDSLIKCAKTQLYSKKYQIKVKEYLKKGYNYPTSLSKALIQETGIDISRPNDLLGLGYIKEILKNDYPITPIAIQRTNNYHETNFTGMISSATSIREHLKKSMPLEDTIPPFVKPFLKNIIFLEQFFPYLKYKILSEPHLGKYETVDEKLENKIKETIMKADSLEEFISLMKTKYYTYNRLMRMCSHILFSFTKEENEKLKDNFYIRILGFSDLGRNYLKYQKDSINIPIITNYSNDKKNQLELETRIAKILSLLKGKEFFENEIKRKPIYEKKDK